MSKLNNMLLWLFCYRLELLRPAASLNDQNVSWRMNDQRQIVLNFNQNLPSLEMLVSSESSCDISLSRSCNSGGGIILVDMTGPGVNTPPSSVTMLLMVLATLACTLHLPSPSALILRLTIPFSPSASSYTPSIVIIGGEGSAAQV